MRRCEEITQSDEDFKKRNEEILKTEKKLMNQLPKELIPMLLKLDALKEKQTSEAYIKIYLTGRSDKSDNQ